MLRGVVTSVGTLRVHIREYREIERNKREVNRKKVLRRLHTSPEGPNVSRFQYLSLSTIFVTLQRWKRSFIDGLFYMTGGGEIPHWVPLVPVPVR